MGIGSQALDPIRFAQYWDKIRIANVYSPGKVTISEAKRPHEWDQKKGKGVRGATMTFVGLPLATFKATFTLGYLHADGGGLWQDFIDWGNFRPLFEYDPTRKAPKAVDIQFPSLGDIDIRSCVTEDIGAIEHKGEGLYEVVVSFTEYAPPPKKSVVATPTGSQAQAPAPTSPPSVTLTQSIADLLPGFEKSLASAQQEIR